MAGLVILLALTIDACIACELVSHRMRRRASSVLMGVAVIFAASIPWLHQQLSRNELQRISEVRANGGHFITDLSFERAGRENVAEKRLYTGAQAVISDGTIDYVAGSLEWRLRRWTFLYGDGSINHIKGTLNEAGVGFLYPIAGLTPITVFVWLVTLSGLGWFAGVPSSAGSTAPTAAGLMTIAPRHPHRFESRRNT